MRDPSKDFKGLEHEFTHGFLKHAYQDQELPQEQLSQLKAAFMCGSVVAAAMCLKAVAAGDIELLHLIESDLGEYGYQLYKAEAEGGPLP